MLLRIFRARLRPGREEQAIGVMRGVSEQLARAPGLQSIHLARRLDDDVEAVEIVSVWRDADALAATLGPRWQHPYLPGNLAELVDGPTVDHMETIFDHVAALDDDDVARGRA